MKELQEQIEEARRMVKINQSKAAKSGATIEDELNYEKSRNWLLSLELRVWKGIATLQRKLGKGQQPAQAAKPKPMTPKERAEAAFAQLQKEGA
ncbi:hypothetical protein [Roseibium sediminis]|uniref:hypothetical protein n=1 Tax=Roseibium sediminis TaxID=1775174 RepID=UPI00123D6CAB|nr:hypothetical protein [Roseibium sediminis]